MAGYSQYVAMAEEMGFTPQDNPYYGVLDPSVVGLRAFKAFHKDAMDPVEIAGRTRLLTHKQLRLHGLITRIAVTGEWTTMKAIAAEAHCVTTTVSRFIDKLQVWGLVAADVKRGRHGGVRFRMRGLYDGLAAYAERAWVRVERAAYKALSRMKLKVASIFPLTEGMYEQADSTLVSNVVLMDATFMEVWDANERRGSPVLERQGDPETSFDVLGRGNSPDEEWERAEGFARAVLAERLRLAIVDPAGEAEAVRPLW